MSLNNRDKLKLESKTKSNIAMALNECKSVDSPKPRSLRLSLSFSVVWEKAEVSWPVSFYNTSFHHRPARLLLFLLQAFVTSSPTPQDRGLHKAVISRR